MHGHGVAFLQLNLVTDRSATFNASFGNWLVSTKGGSAAAGWAVEIEEFARATGVDAVELFFELADEFFDSRGKPEEPTSGC